MKFHFGKSQDLKELWLRTISEPPHVLGVDTETVSLKDRSILGTGIAISRHDAFYVTSDDPDHNEILKLLSNPKIIKAYHNAPYDLRVLRKYGIDTSNVDDTAIAARLKRIGASLEEASYWVNMEVKSVKQVMFDYGLGEKKGATMLDLPVESVAKKCCVDCMGTYALWEYLQDIIQSDYYKVERALIPILETVSARGVKLDAQRNEELETHYQRDYSYYKTVAEGMGFSPSKRFEVAYMLSERGVFLPFTKSKTQLATDEKTLRKITIPEAVPIAQLVLLYRHAEYQLSHFIRPFKGQDRAYTHMHMDAATGRINGGEAGKGEPDRNLLNITKKADRDLPPDLRVRSQFIPDEDVFTLADDSQAEMRILAYMSQDPVMLGVFNSGGDLHGATEKALWGTDGPNRVTAKVFGYAMLYGSDAQTVSDNTGWNDLEQISHLMNVWAETYSVAWSWREEQVKLAEQQGYVETLYGRQMPVPIDMGEKHAANCAINYPIQGTAADIFKRTIVECWAEPDLHDSLLLYIHDERMANGRVEIPKDLADVSPVHIPVESVYPDRWR